MKITGDAVFEDDEEEEDINAGNSVAKRMLTTMLNRTKPKEVKKKAENVKTETGASATKTDTNTKTDTSGKTDFIEPNGTTNGAANGSRTTKTDSLGAVYQRSGETGSLRFAKDAAREKVVSSRVKQEIDVGYSAKALMQNKDVAYKDEVARKSDYQLGFGVVNFFSKKIFEKKTKIENS